MKRQRSTIVALNADEAAAQIGQYMAGELTDEPWQAFGLRKAPIVGGTGCLLHTHASNSLEDEKTVLMVSHIAQ